MDVFVLLKSQFCTGITNKGTGEAATDLGSSTTPVVSDPVDLAPVLSKLDSQLKQLYNTLPPRTAVIIFSGHADPRRMSALNARKSSFESALRGGKGMEELSSELRWTSADGRALEEEVERAKRGLLFLGIKDGK